MFNEELNLVKKEFNRQSPSLTPFQPLYAGKATWARSLKKRIDTPMKVGYQKNLCIDFLCISIKFSTMKELIISLP